MFLAVFAPAYLLLFGVKSSPSRSLSAYIACFLLWPKVSLHEPALNDMSAYLFMWPITTSALALSVLLRPGRTGRPGPGLRICLWFAAAAATVSFMASWFLGAEQGLLPDALEGRLRVYNYVLLMQAVWFSYLFARAVRSADQAEEVFQLFALGGALLTIESILFAYLRIPSPGGYALDMKNSHFQSLFFTSFTTLEFFLVFAFACSLYLALARRNRTWWAAATACVLPVLATFERAPLLGMAVAAGLVFLATRRRKLSWLAGGAILCFTSFSVVRLYGTELGRFLGGGLREDYASTSSMSGRLAIWIRGLENGAAAFPWGVGPGLGRYQMGSSVSLPAVTQFRSDDADFWTVYSRLSQGLYETNIHNLYITFFVENGLLGVAAVAVICAAFLFNLSALLRLPLPVPEERRRPHLLWLSACGALAGLGTVSFFEVDTTMLFMVLPLLHVCSICRKELSVPRPGAPARI